MKTTRTYIVAIWTVCLTAIACQQDEFIGPDVNGLYGNFEVVSDFGHDKPSGVDFSTGETVGFVGEFNVAANWTITITGQESGATKVVTGTGTKLDGIVEWDGRADGVFFKDEVCAMTITFEGFDDVFSDSVTVNSTVDYTSSAVVLSGFESSTGITGVANADSKDQVRVMDGTAPEGDYYFRITGNEPGGAYWLGALRFAGVQGQLPDRAPEDVYFNAFFSGMNLAGTKAQIKFIEDDNDDGSPDETWRVEVLLDGSGWNLVSFPMSDAVLDGSFSNNIKEPSKVMQIDITLSTNGAAAASDPSHGYLIDFVAFTEDSSL